MRRRAAITLLAALAIGAGVAACGSSSSSSSTAAAVGGATVTAPTDAQVKARLNLATCLRAKGINVPDSAATGTAGAGAALRQLLTEYSPTQLRTALTDCKAQAVVAIPALSLSPAQIAQREQEALAFVKCLRAHGINVPDPVASGLRVGIVKALSNIDTASPAFQKANTACASLRPGRLAPG